MKTYSESKNAPPFNWIEFLNKDKISEVEWEQAELRSKSWITCACGNLCDAIPRTISGAPEDPKLCELGIDFFEAVFSRVPREALLVLHKIEKRSEFLIKKINEA